MTGTIRRPAVAGYFYPSDAAQLLRTVEELTRSRGEAAAAVGLLLPHGSYERSGAITGLTCAQAVIPRRCIIIGPSHTGSWLPWSLAAEGSYRTPLGEVPVDAACAEALRARCPFLATDAWAQQGEHAVEVLVPFLQYRGPSDLTIVPIVMASSDTEERRQLADALAQVIRLQEDPTLLIASTDLSHYEPRAVGALHDRQLIEAMCALDPEALTRLVRERELIMCGAGAAACVLSAAKQLGAQQGHLVQYGSSAERGGDPHAAIGYAGIVIT